MEGKALRICAESIGNMGKVWITVIIILTALVIWAVCDIIYDVRSFRITRYELHSDKIKEDFRFVLLSDLHGSRFGKGNCRLARAVRNLKPDAVLIAGDMVTAKCGEDFSDVLALLGELAKECPVYYGMGNHEEKLGRKKERYGSMYDDYMSALAKAGIRPLINETRTLPRYGVSICGLQIEPRFFKRFSLPEMTREDIVRQIGEPDAAHYQILIAHHPDYFPEYAAWGADLVLSGHNHGGIVNVPFLGGLVSPRCVLFPKYDGGKFTQGASTMLLSRGVGTHTLPVRLLNRSEIVLVELKKDLLF